MNLKTKKLCRLGLLTAITVILAMFFTFRIGTMIKIPLKFVSVFITGVFFGPVWGGVVGALGDFFNAVLMPVGAYIPLLTLIEFLCGFTYGALLFNIDKRKSFLPVTICLILQFLIDEFLTPVILVQCGIFPDYSFALITRTPASILKVAIQGIAIYPCKYYLKYIRRFMNEQL